MYSIIAGFMIFNAIFGLGWAEFTCDSSGSAAYTDSYPTIPSVFKTRVEINYVTEKKSATTQWFYDFDKRKAAIEIKEGNSIYNRIYSYETDEVFEMEALYNRPSFPVESNDGQPLYPTSCITEKLSTYKPSNPIYDFGLANLNGILYPKESSELFQFYNGVSSFSSSFLGLVL